MEVQHFPSKYTFGVHNCLKQESNRYQYLRRQQ